ncbi:MAG: PD-(D/E)XK nuclease family protein [Lachnospiraceae bacterium]|nr:PD-(D/E)XK nuclease family protein [Lachnospiraceae bacterium]
MLLSDFLNLNINGRKTIFANRVSYVNDFLRKFNMKENVNIFNVEAKSLFSIASEIVVANCAINQLKFPEIIDGQEAVYLLDEVMRNHHFDTITDACLSIQTIRDILNCVNEIRMNECTEAWDNCQEAKIQDLKQIVELYENNLCDKNIYDRALLVCKAIEIIKKGTYDELCQMLPWVAKDAVIADLKSNVWSDLERGLIVAIKEKMETKNDFCFAEIEDCYCGEDISIQINKADISIYTAYGMVNEVRQIAQLILEDKESAYGDCVVYYSSAAYLNYIKASFEAKHIPFVMTNGYPATELNLTQLFLDMICAAKEDFSYELFQKVALNPVMTFMNMTENNKDTIYLNPIKGYYDALKDGIGWGRDRYYSYKERTDSEGDERIKKTEKDIHLSEEEKEKIFHRVAASKIFALFLVDYCDVFNENKTAYDILCGMWEFVKKYTYKRNTEKRKLSELIVNQCSALKYYDNRGRSFHEKLELIEDFLQAMIVSDEPDSAAVAVTPINGVQVVERKRVFFLGMSSANFTQDTKQSPILLDNEKIKYIKHADSDTSSVVMATRKNMQRRRAYIRTIAGITEGKIVFLLNNYDTAALRASSPSVFLMEMAGTIGVTENEFIQAVGYPTVKEDILVDSEILQKAIKVYGEKKREQFEEKASRAKAETTVVSPLDRELLEEDGKDTEFIDASEEYSETEEILSERIDIYKNDKKTKLSATGLQDLLLCPLKYYYKYINGLFINEQKKPSGHEWLKPFSKGNLCHYTMQQYFSRYMPPNGKYCGKVNEKALRDIVAECANEIEKVEPYLSKSVRKQEEEYYYEMILLYLTKVVTSWETEHPWKVIGCEINFNDLEYCVVSKEKNHAKLFLDGSIDRMDGYVDGDNKLHLRIIDYKTGKNENKQEEVDAGIQIQHYMYGIAAIDYLKRNQDELLRIFCVDEFSGYEFDMIGYVFPYEVEGSRLLDVTDYVKNDKGNVLTGSIDELSIDFPFSVRTKIDKIVGAYQAGDVVDFAENCEAVIAEIMNENIERILKKKNSEIESKVAAKNARKKDGEPKEVAKLLIREDIEKDYTIDNFCGPFCQYRNICRKWVGGISDEI